MIFNHCIKRNDQSFKQFSKSPCMRCFPIWQEVLNISQITIAFHRISPPFLSQAWLQPYSRSSFFYSAHCSFSDPMCFWSVWRGRAMMSLNIDLKIIRLWNCTCDLRAPRPLLLGFEAHPRRSPFHPCALSGIDRARLHGPIRFPQHLFSVHDHGRLRSSWEPQLLPALTKAWLYIEPSPCGVVRPAGDPVDSDPGAVFEDDPHPRSDAGRPLEPWVRHHTREPTVLSRLSCRPFHRNFDRFHQPCLLPGRTSRISEDCRPRTTWRPLTLFGQHGSSSFASHWKFLPRRLDGTTAGC